MIKLTPMESKALQLIEEWQKKYRNSPIIPDFTHHLQRSRSQVYAVLKSLQDKGFIDLIRVRRRLIIFPLYWE